MFVLSKEAIRGLRRNGQELLDEGQHPETVYYTIIEVFDLIDTIDDLRAEGEALKETKESREETRKITNELQRQLVSGGLIKDPDAHDFNCDWLKPCNCTCGAVKEPEEG